MPIREGYFAQVKNYLEPDSLICVSLKYPFFIKKGLMEHMLVLAPSEDLLDDWKSRSITWSTYEERFIEEITLSPKAMNALKEIASEAHKKDIRLLCWEKGLDKKCHRFLLLDILNSMEAEN